MSDRTHETAENDKNPRDFVIFCGLVEALEAKLA